MMRRSALLHKDNTVGAMMGSLKKFTSWYPQQGGEFLGNALAGHNMFIQDIPKKFDTKHARHFSFVEALTVTPLFTLSIVHYFSIFMQYSTRAQLIPPLMTELSKKTELQKQWLDVLQKKSPTDVIAWRAGMITIQVALFPLWLMVSAIAPQLVHSTMQHTNHILYTKYECIGQGEAPAFVSANVAQCKLAEDFHEKQTNIPTDFAAAVVLFLLVLYVTS